MELQGLTKYQTGKRGAMHQGLGTVQQFISLVPRPMHAQHFVACLVRTILHVSDFKGRKTVERECESQNSKKSEATR